MSVKLKTTWELEEKIRRTIWPNLDDAAKIIYENSKNRNYFELKISPYMYSLGKKAITIGTIISAYYLLK
ncbi:MAG: hypothetical protein QXK76_00575 [Candidatus Woesearchaeota archaeon]